jgi:hypothetical protein
MLPEKRIENAIKAYVRAHKRTSGDGSFVVKLFANGEQGKTTLDLVGSFRGKPFMVEVKAPNGKTSLIQSMLVKQARKGGYVSGVVDSVMAFIDLFEEPVRHASSS